MANRSRGGFRRGGRAAVVVCPGQRGNSLSGTAAHSVIKATFPPSSLRDGTFGNGELITGLRFHWRPYHYLVGGAA